MAGFQDAISVAFQTLQDSAGVDVTYTSGATFGTVQAIPANTLAETVDESNAMVKTRRKDYLVSVAALAAIGISDHPQRGDTIEETLGDTVYKWEAIGPSGQPPWVWHDGPIQETYRIHVQLIAETPV